MKTSTLLKQMTLCIAIGMMTLGISAQTTYTVNNNPNTTADFTDLQAAINAASSGDIIYVQQSITTYGNIVIDKGLTIVGRSHSDPNYASRVELVTFAAGASNTTLKGLFIHDIGTSNLQNPVSNLKFYDNYITSMDFARDEPVITNVLVKGNILTRVGLYSGASNFIFTNNYFQGENIYVINVSTTTFINNIFYLGQSNVIYNISEDILNISNSLFIGPYNLTFYGNYQLNNCLTYKGAENETVYIVNQSGDFHVLNNCLQNTNPLFLGDVFPNYSYNPATSLELQPTSPAIGSGYGGVDMGIYGNYNFKPYGTPNGVPSLKVQNYSSAVPKNGTINVTIKADSN